MAHAWRERMSTGKEQLEVEEDLVATDDDNDDTDAPVEVAKTNLSKRRTIDNLLEERRLQKRLADLDFDI
jgi:hypothetical protein